MLVHERADDEIAPGPTERPGVSLTGDSHLQPGVDAGRDRHRHRFHRASHAPPLTRRTRTRIDAAGGSAVHAGGEPGHVQPEGGAGHRVGKRQFDRHVTVVTSAPGGQRIAAEPGAEAIVERARVGVTEDAIGLGDLVEQRARRHIPEIHVRRVLPREPLVRLADLARPRGRGDAENRVVVSPHHSPTSSRPGPRIRRRPLRLPWDRRSCPADRPRPARPGPAPRGTSPRRACAMPW